MSFSNASGHLHVYVYYCFRSKLPDTLNLSAFPRTLLQGEKDPKDYDFGKGLDNSWFVIYRFSLG